MSVEKVHIVEITVSEIGTAPLIILNNGTVLTGCTKISTTSDVNDVPKYQIEGYIINDN